jgi:hypothetical protein
MIDNLLEIPSFFELLSTEGQQAHRKLGAVLYSVRGDPSDTILSPVCHICWLSSTEIVTNHSSQAFSLFVSTNKIVADDMRSSDFFL